MVLVLFGALRPAGMIFAVQSEVFTLPPNTGYGKRIQITQHGVSFTMFVHPGRDTVSDWIQKNGEVYCDAELVEQFGTWKARDEAEGSHSVSPAVLLDVGANIGSCSVLAAAMGLEVWAFEPLPLNFGLLQRTVSANAGFADRLHIVPCGASESKGKFDIYTLPDNYGHSMIGATQPELRHKKKGGYKKYQCCTVRMDDVLPADLAADFMKLDTEGHELFALRGAINILGDPQRAPLFVNFEVNVNSQDAAGVERGAVQAEFKRNKYRVVEADGAANTLHDVSLAFPLYTRTSL
jgi:FkbM family methyltransferase